MAIQTGGVHHLDLTVKDARRSLAFYTNYLGFKHLTDFGPKVLMSNGTLILALNPPPDPAESPINDKFSEHRIGLDHLSLSVASLSDLNAAVKLFDENGIPHGELENLAAIGITVLPFRDPDNIQLELTAPNA